MPTKHELDAKFLKEARSFAEDYVESTSPRELLGHMELFQLAFILFVGITFMALFKGLILEPDIGAAIASLAQLLCIVLSLKYSSHLKSGRNILVFLLVMTIMSSVVFFIGPSEEAAIGQYYVFNPYIYGSFYGFTIFLFKLLVERQVEYELYQELHKKAGTIEKGWLAATKEKIVGFIDRLLMP